MCPFGAADIPIYPTNGAFDIAVVGGGPVGCVTALAFARRGLRVCLIDAGTQSSRLAGEWLHPTGAGILAELAVDLNRAGIAHSLGRGFAIFPKGAEPIVLPYVGGELGIGCQHHLLVGALQQCLTEQSNITLLSGYRVAEVSRGRLTAVNGGRSTTVQITAGLVVGADGRQSVVRQALGYAGACRPLSYMVGVLIAANALPFAEHGNVFLGGPGPVLAFRVDETQARVCIDVPANRVAWIRNPPELLAAYRPTLPRSVAAACEAALANGAPAVAANQWLRRRQYGRARVALVGDAVGHCHPLCAVGMSVGFLDAITLANSASVEEYAAARRTAGRVPELLSMGLYDLFASSEAGSPELRDAVYHLWRTSAAARRDTMRLLAVRETRRCALGVTFARLLSTASRQTLTGVFDRPISRTLATVAGFGRWAGWFARESLV
jgi:2-polyprenyl-6-methoxyphenol hydroxylase-like FAD-dependent oxidoreductase